MPIGTYSDHIRQHVWGTGVFLVVSHASYPKGAEYQRAKKILGTSTSVHTV